MQDWNLKDEIVQVENEGPRRKRHCGVKVLLTSAFNAKTLID